MLTSDEYYESWYDMAADFTSPSSTTTGAGSEVTSTEAKLQAEQSLDEFSSYLKTIGEAYTLFTAHQTSPSTEGDGMTARGAARAEPVNLDEVPKVRAPPARAAVRRPRGPGWPLGNMEEGACSRTRCPAAQLLFAEDFQLEDPHTFAVFSPPGAPSSTMALQERLTHYLDLVEVNLLHAVATRSEEFYTALGSWSELTAEVREGCAEIERLRAVTHAINSRLAGTALRLPGLCRKRANHRRLYKRVHLIASIRQAQPAIQALLNAEDYLGALELIRTTQDVLAGDLKGVRCFHQLEEQLREMSGTLTQLMIKVARASARRARVPRSLTLPSPLSRAPPVGRCSAASRRPCAIRPRRTSWRFSRLDLGPRRRQMAATWRPGLARWSSAWSSSAWCTLH